MSNRTILPLLLAALAAMAATGCESVWPRTEEKPDWSRQLNADPEYFPLAVWMQAPEKAERWRDIGINLYINLWKGPTDDQLAQLTDAEMPVFCEMEFDARANVDNPIIVGWLHTDEPDNAQKISGEGELVRYGPPVLPSEVVARFHEIKKIDPTRPVMLNLGQGVAWDGWKGRGVRTNHPEDYAQYLKGCDMASFDIYPVVHNHEDVAGNLWYVGRGVSRLKDWSQGKRMVWAAIEASRIGNVHVKPTPAQIRSEVWMAIIHGARGIVYFAHQFEPRFDASAILSDPEMYEGVKALNEEVRSLARVINAPEPDDNPMVQSSETGVPIAMMLRRDGRKTYLFTVAMRDRSTVGTFKVPGIKNGSKVKVIGEDRTIKVVDGGFTDDFDGYRVHLYRVK